jgi:CPA1 family monovalent cation:H+ antiporter
MDPPCGDTPQGALGGKDGRVGVFAGIASLFGITAVLSHLNDRYLRLQSDIGLLLLAVLVTLALRAWEVLFPSGVTEALGALTQSFNLNETLLKGVLCFLLFRGSVNVHWSSLREQRWLVLTLAFVGTAVACVITGGLSFLALTALGVTITLAQALLFGALIAATDPIAALSILSKIGLPRNLETVVDGESLLNDGVAVVLFTIFAGVALGSGVVTLGGAGSIFVREVLGGGLLGLAGWLVIHYLMLRAKT